MGLKFIEQHEITYYECDISKNITLPMLINILIKTSEGQTNKLTNIKIMEENNLGWIITQYDMKINRLPKQGEIVFITTNANSYNKYFCYRDFWLNDQEGNLLVELNAVFALMDLKNRKIAFIDDKFIEPYKAEKTTKLKRFEKIDEIKEITNKKDYQVRYFDLDGNGHVNNTHYFDWMLDTLDFDFLSTKIPKKMRIKFDKEVHYGMLVQSIVEVDEDNLQTKHVIKDASDNTKFAEALIEWN